MGLFDRQSRLPRRKGLFEPDVPYEETPVHDIEAILDEIDDALEAAQILGRVEERMNERSE